ncbi:inactive polyglycylase TTLL10 isoform X2 [Hemicordylus capensis]|uniref:inactive polyglycylase TTLL10 isoform X2 n=1 Tax=Hemicordylus capensis TaxID=884348 RepID=UPI002302233F|nr:inactive polyglycylase TTLL10 isoform X2 [Hemicordylus capensis]
MESGGKRNCCAFTVYLDGSDDEGKGKKADTESMQEAFERFRRRRQEEFWNISRRKASVRRMLLQPDDQWQLRMKFLEQAKSYIGIPYAKKYHEPGTPEYESPLFLDCCGLIRRVLQDLSDDFGFSVGLGNQAYLYDTLPVSIPSEEHLKPGDLIFISGTYFDTQRKKQPHDIIHVEIWLGDGKRSLGARLKHGCVQVFESYKFVSRSYGNMAFHFRSIETWLQGVCNSHCLEHKWASARELPPRKSIFCPWSERDGFAEEGEDTGESTPRSHLRKGRLLLRAQHIAESISDCGLHTSQQTEVLALPGSSRGGSGFSTADPERRGRILGACPSLNHFPASSQLEATGLNVECSDASLEGTGGQEEGSDEGPVEPPTMTPAQEADARPSEVTRGAANVARKSRSRSKVNSKWVLGGSKQRKKGRAGKHRSRQLLDEPPPADTDSKRSASRWDNSVHMFENPVLKDSQTQKLSSTSNPTEGEPTNETKSKGHRGIPKASPRMSHLEEKKPEDPGSGPFFYLGGANGVDILNLYCKSKGWQRIHDNRREDYILKWCETKFRDTYYNFREGEQLLYQIPNNKILTTKIGLLMNLREYERIMRKISKNVKVLRMEDFFPETFRLDTKDEREIFFEIYREPHIWICKPTGSNQGRGIFLLKNYASVRELQAKLLSVEEDPMYKKVPYKIPQARIVQRYIDRPLLLEGKKFDVRSYLLIACTVPYMLFFGHGYVRLTCLNYDPKSEDLIAHLTNQYVQKKSPMYNHVKEETVWTMGRFNTYVNERFRPIKGLPKDWVFNGFTKRMKEIMLQCFQAVKSKLDCKLGYFDLIGCDFLIDEDFKVWLLEMNANPALHTNCSALKSIIPRVVNETLDLAFEIFTKSQKGQAILPLDSASHFALLYNGSSLDLAPPRITRSRTSLRSLRSHRSQLELTSSTSGCSDASSSSITSYGGSTTSYGSGTSRLTDKLMPKALEKTLKVEAKADPPGLPEGLPLPPKGTPRNPLPMPQIQISIVPSLSSCPSVKAVLRGHQVSSIGSQYIIKPILASSEKLGFSKAESGDDRGKMAVGVPMGIASKDRSYSSWFQQMFGSKFHPSSGSGYGAGLPLTSLQMVSLHLQSNIPPSLPELQDLPKSSRQTTTHAKTEGGKALALAVPRSCSDPLPEDKKVSHRGS